jgi:anti-sigma regulatory factor (Ser/Thr protein kinase)
VPTVHLPNEVGSVGRARHWVDGVLRGWELGALSPDAMLLVSELVTNVIVHARTPVEVSIELDDEVVTVSVCDGSDELPVLGAVDEEPGGLGLNLVDRLAGRWGSERSGAGSRSGKVVWFELPVGVAGD